MEFKLSKTALLSRLNSVSKMIQAKNSLPILSNFLFEVQNNVIEITAANDEGQVKTSVECMSDSSFKVCIGASMLITGLKSLPEQPIVFNINETTLEISISYQGGKFVLPGFETTTFPSPNKTQFTDQQLSGTLSMPAGQLLSGINHVHNLAADDDLRPTLASVYIDSLADKTIFVGADGHALGTCEMNIKSTAPSFMLSKKMCNIIKSILPGVSGDAVVKVGSSHAMIVCDQYEIYSRLVEGRYPNYNSVMPKNNDKIVKVETNSLVGAITRVSAFASKSTSLLVLDIALGAITVTATDTDFSTNAEETIPCDSMSAPIKIGVKYSILLDVLSHIDTERCVISFSGPSTALTVVPEEQGKPSLTYLVMPMTLNN